MHHRQNQMAIVPPAPGTVPSELGKVMLPEYVIEPPDVLRIQAIIRLPKKTDPEKDAQGNDIPGSEKDLTDGKGNKVFSDASADLRSTPLYNVSDNYTVRPDGTVYLGTYGSVPVAGLTVSQAAQAVRNYARRPSSRRVGRDRPALPGDHS